MEVEHIARKGLATRRTAQQQGHLPVGHRLLGEIVIDDQGVHAVVAEEFAHGGTGVRCQELQRGRLRSRSCNDDRILERTLFLQDLHEFRHRGALLPDRHVDAVELARFVVALIAWLLIDEGIKGNGSLSGLPVADDQLALTAPDRDQAVNRLQPGLHGFVHGLPRDDPRRLHIDT